MQAHLCRQLAPWLYAGSAGMAGQAIDLIGKRRRVTGPNAIRARCTVLKTGRLLEAAC